MAEQNPELKLAQIRSVLADVEAEYVDRQDDAAVGLLGDREVKRAFVLPVSREEEGFDDLVSYLELYTATKNDDPLRYVEDLVIQGTELEGKWRHAYAYRLRRQDPSNPRDTQHILVQVLRKGYIEALVSGTTLDWSEARVEKNLDITAGANTATSYVGGDDPERFITTYFPNVSPFKVKAITDTIFALAAGTFVPVIKGDSSYGNAYHRLGVGHVIENDGSATIRLMLAKPQFVLDAYTTYLTGRQMDVTYLWNVPKELAQGILTAWKTVKGRSATASYSSSQMLVDIVLYSKDYTEETLLNEITFKNCDYEEVTNYYWGIEDATDYDITLPVAAGVTAWKSISNNGDGSYDVIIRYRTVQKREYWMPSQAEYDAGTTTEMKSVENGVVSELFEGRQYGITDAADILDLDTPIQGYIKRQTINIRDDCSYDTTTQIRESKDDDEYVTWETRNGTATLRIFINKTDSEWTDFKTAYIDSPALDDTTENTVSIHYNEDGTFSGYVATRPFKVQYYMNFDDGTIDYFKQKLYLLGDPNTGIILRWTLGRLIGSLAAARAYANASAKEPPTILGRTGKQPPGGWVDAVESRDGKYMGFKESWEKLDGTSVTTGFADVTVGDLFAPIIP